MKGKIWSRMKWMKNKFLFVTLFNNQLMKYKTYLFDFENWLIEIYKDKVFTVSGCIRKLTCFTFMSKLRSQVQLNVCERWKATINCLFLICILFTYLISNLICNAFHWCFCALFKYLHYLHYLQFSLVSKMRTTLTTRTTTTQLSTTKTRTTAPTVRTTRRNSMYFN